MAVYGNGYNNYGYNFPYNTQPWNTPYQQNSLQAQPSIPPQQNQENPSNGINWVQGDAGAKSFYVAPGTTAQLMDSEDYVFYIKSVDVSGMPLPLKKYRYKEESVDSNAPAQTKEYITKDEVLQLLEGYVTKTPSEAGTERPSRIISKGTE